MGSIATQPGLVLGTPGYMSPEQARGMSVDERTDVFSFGCVLYACLTGVPPFRGETVGDCLASLLKDAADLERLPAQAPPRVRQLLAACLEKEQARRPREIAVVRREIEASILEIRGPVVSGVSSAAPFASLIGAPSAPRHNLPRQLGSFVGRRRELDQLRAILGSAPLLTLTGAGGCGKTRLALRLAEEQLDAFPGGVWVVELAGVADPGMVQAAVGAVLGVKQEPGRSLLSLIVHQLQGRTSLLILDNCEHLLAAAAELAADIVAACPTARIISTSRESLGIEGERTWRVPSLGLPELEPPSGSPSTEEMRQAESVQLFLERAASAKPGFVESDSDIPTIAQICRRLDGIPLAIELAAARVKVLSVGQILEKLSDRFRLLVGGSRRALERHQTLRAAIDWSYDLLSPEEQGVLRRLSVFAGGSTLEAAAMVCAPALTEGADEFALLDVLTHLVDKSLVLADEDVASGRQARYRMLETVRQYARDRLHSPAGDTHEATDASDRHVRYFLDLAERAESELVGKQQQQWLERLAADQENFLAAVEWCATAPAIDGSDRYGVDGLRITGALGRFWSMRGYLSVGRSAVRAALARAPQGAPTPALAKSLNAAGSLELLLGALDAARGYWERALEIQRALGNTRAVAGVLNNLGLIAESQADYAAAHRLYTEALETNKQLGNRAWEAININNLGNLAWNNMEYAEARSLYEEAMAINRQLGNRAEEAKNLNNLGSVSRESGDAAAARQHYREALRIKQELRDRRGIALTLGQLSLVATQMDDAVSAAKLATESLLMRRELADRVGIAMSLEECSVIANQRAANELGARMFAAADALRREVGSPLAAGERLRMERGADAVRAALGDERFSKAWKRGTLDGATRLCDEALAWLGTVR
jgi:predicted ATPase/Tfp pilus assembly protein PilF